MASANPGSDPELAALLPACMAELRIFYGAVPRALLDAVVHGVLYEASKTEALLEIPGLARLRVARNEIAVALAPDAAAQDLGPYLRRTPLMVVMLLRGGFSCSAAAVAGPDGAVLLIGTTVSGKSTLAAALIKRGLRLLADDAAPLVLGQSGAIEVLPVWPELLLWPDAVRTLFGKTPIWLQDSTGEIPWRAVTPERFCAEPMPLRRLYLLSPDRLEDAVSQNAVSGFAKLLSGMVMPYQADLTAALVDPVALLHLYGALNATVKTDTLAFPRRAVSEMGDIADRIMQDCGW